jgi:hypothetical protein
LVSDSLLVGPPGRRDASAEVDEILLGDVDVERTDRAAFGATGGLGIDGRNRLGVAGGSE